MQKPLAVYAGENNYKGGDGGGIKMHKICTPESFIIWFEIGQMGRNPVFPERERLIHFKASPPISAFAKERLCSLPPDLFTRREKSQALKIGCKLDHLDQIMV